MGNYARDEFMKNIINKGGKKSRSVLISEWVVNSIYEIMAKFASKIEQIWKSEEQHRANGL